MTRKFVVRFIFLNHVFCIPNVYVLLGLTLLSIMGISTSCLEF
jgi:hypothetical protein